MEQSEFLERYQYDVTKDLLGGGGFGKVYRAYDDFRDRHVAIKIAEVLPDLEHLSLRHEVELSKKLPDHKHICHYEDCYRFNMSNGVFDYGILQYYPEGNLSQVIKSSSLSEGQKVQLVEGIIKGMTFLHQNNVIHRDLKSSNILISKKGDSLTPKIADFGLSKTIDDMENTFHSNSFVGGSIAYSAPEQLTGGKVKSNLDIWSLGVILYEIFNGEVPFKVDADYGTGDYARLELLAKINQAIVPDEVHSIPKPYQLLVQACLIKDVDLRLQTMDQVNALKEGKLKWKIPENNSSSDETFVVDRETLRKVSGMSSKKASTPSRSEQAIQEELPSKEKKSKRRPIFIVFFGILIAIVGYWGKQTINSQLIIEQSGDFYTIKNKEGNILYQGFEEVDQSFFGNTIATRNDTLFTYTRTGILASAIHKSKPKQKKATSVDEGSLVVENSSPDDVKLNSISEKEKQDEKDTAIAENKNWTNAKRDNTIASFESYLRKHPRGVHSIDAQNRIKALIKDLNQKDEVELWRVALNSNSIATLQSFIKQYPNSDKVRIANQMIKDIKIADEESLWKTAKANPTKTSLDNYLKVYPKGIHRVEAERKLEELNNQLARLYFDQIKASRNTDRMIAFIDNYPNFEDLNEAKNLLELWKEDSILNEMIKRNNPEELKRWVAENPSHKKKPEVEALLSKTSSNNSSNAVPPIVADLEKDMISISSSSYKLGCKDCKGDQSRPKEYPIGNIKMGKYEVTNRLYKQVTGLKPPSDMADCYSCPVTNISLYDVRRFLEKLNSLPGNPYKYRLPTEAEWEYAALGGSRNVYSGGKDLSSVAYYKANSKRAVHKVGQKKANRYGLHDMSGNVYEWTESWYDERGYNVANPSKEEKVIRGGGWNSNSKKCEVKARSAVYPGDKNAFTGFRLVRE